MKLKNYERVHNIILMMYLYIIVCWVINVIQFLLCDFEEPFKEEAIKLLGTFIPPLAGITVWF